MFSEELFLLTGYQFTHHPSVKKISGDELIAYRRDSVVAHFRALDKYNEYPRKLREFVMYLSGSPARYVWR